MGIAPDIIVLRCDEPLEPAIFQKIALFCNVKPDCVIENRTLPELYEAPLMLEKSAFSSVVCRELGIQAPAPDLREWEALADGSTAGQDRWRSPSSENIQSSMTPISPLSKHCTTPAMSSASTSGSAGSTQNR